MKFVSVNFKNRQGNLKMQELEKLYENIKSEIETRISEFDAIRKNGDNMVFLKELVFCLMTPQSKAKTCAKVAEEIFNSGEVFRVSKEKLSNIIRNVRFRNNKARYIKEAIKKFENFDMKEKLESFSSSRMTRKWLVENINGYGYKEASHFLRNVGFGYDLSILDRHIIKNLVKYGVIDSVPKSITPRRYEEIEDEMRKFSNELAIPMHHLDFLLWYKETKEVFK